MAVFLVRAGASHGQLSVPQTQAFALDGHPVEIPRNLTGPTIFIVGFSRASADATTAWEIPVRRNLANDRLSFYDLPVLERVPGFLHGWVVRSLKGKVPLVLQSRFLPVFSGEAEWKQACGYDDKAPDAAYVLLTDRDGKVLWRTHEPYSAAGFADLKAQAEKQSGRQ